MVSHVRDICSVVVGVFGVIFIIFGLAFGLNWKDYFEDILNNEMVLGPNKKGFEMWKKPTIPMSLDIYFFNWTNPEEFKIPGKKPILKELGPYRFTEKPDKTNINWIDENSTISFRQKSNFYFDAEGSNGSLDDNITTLNIIALSAAAKAKDWSYMKRRAVGVGLYVYNQNIHVSKTADELLFTGYEDDIITMAKQMPLFGQESVEIPFDRFGWFYMRNASDELLGHFNMYTGEDDLSKLGNMGEWNYRNRTDFFPEHCGEINGSAAGFFPPNQVKEKPISFFSPDMCRTLTLDYESEVYVSKIKGYKYSGGAKLVDNGTQYPDNWCFCAGECVPSGLLNVSSCRFGTPAFMSLPHYYGADPYYLNQVEGLKPIQEKHEFYMTLEPRTGVPLDVAARFQVNMLVKPIPDISLYEDAPYIFFPVLWFEQRVIIPEEMAGDLKLVFIMPKAGHIFSIVITVVGILMVIIFCISQYIKYKRRNNLNRKNHLYMNGVEELKKGGKNFPEESPLMHNTITINGNDNKLAKNLEFVSDKKKDMDINSKYKYLYPDLSLTKEPKTVDNTTNIN